MHQNMNIKLNLYSEGRSSDLIASKREEIKSRIESETEDFLLNVGQIQYVEHLKSEFTLDFPILRFDMTYVDSYEKDIVGIEFPHGFFVEPSKSYKKDVVVYHIPYEGNINLLKFRPNTYNTMAGYNLQVNTKEQEIILPIVDFYSDPKKIADAYVDAQRYILSCYDYLKIEIENFNSTLESHINNAIESRKQKFLDKKTFLASLGVPLKKKQELSQTFSVPNPKLREKISIKPSTTKKGFTPEPALDDENYNRILKIISDIGKNFERMPSVYSDKHEEDLRDHILLILDPNFEFGSASGETFNKSGKTDIQLRYDSSVVFIAECKFWSGEKNYFETIDQLLGYLTWRDSKTCIVIFVRNKEITPVLKTVNDSTKSHKNFIRAEASCSDSWFNFIFSLPIDPNKEIKLAVQLFHIP